MELLRKNAPAKQFVPYCHLSKDADTLTVYFEGDADYSERLSDHVTLYRSLETDEIVGCRVKGVSSIIEDLPNYIQIKHPKHPKVQLSIIFLAFRGGMENRDLAKTMNDLARTATEKQMVLEPCI
jgi:hypothetical protein